MKQRHFNFNWLFALCFLLAPTIYASERVFYIAPTIEGLFTCDQALRRPDLATLEQAQDWCIRQGFDASPRLTELLNKLEPSGPMGQVQIGYVATLQLLSLYEPDPLNGWRINEAHIDAYARLIESIDRPVVVYLAFNHFDTQGPLPQALAQDPQNLMLTQGGRPPLDTYFGYPIIPFTLDPNPNIPVNHYRFTALQRVIQRLAQLPEASRKRIIAYTLAGEVHHLFPQFESGMGEHANIDVTDYSPLNAEAFRQWLLKKHGSLQGINRSLGAHYPTLEAINPPSKNIRLQTLERFHEHYDGYAAGYLPVYGWLWDPNERITHLSLYVNGRFRQRLTTGMHRLDVYRALDEVNTPNTGFRADFDFSSLRPGRHHLQIVAHTTRHRYLVHSADFLVMDRKQSSPGRYKPRRLHGLRALSELSDVRAWTDHPQGSPDLYFNPLAREWDLFRAEQPRAFLKAVFQTAVAAGAPAELIYSHQILPEGNASWNHRLFQSTPSVTPPHPWQSGFNLYGGMADGPWIQSFLKGHAITHYGVPEIHPQQWKDAGAALRVLKFHQMAGAHFVSPYYYSIVPDNYKGNTEHGVNAMEIHPLNSRDGSHLFHEAIVEMAAQ